LKKAYYVAYWEPADQFEVLLVEADPVYQDKLFKKMETFWDGRKGRRVKSFDKEKVAKPDKDWLELEADYNRLCCQEFDIQQEKKDTREFLENATKFPIVKGKFLTIKRIKTRSGKPGWSIRRHR